MLGFLAGAAWAEVGTEASTALLGLTALAAGASLIARKTAAQRSGH